MSFTSPSRDKPFAIYLEPWHADVFEFLDLRKNTGSEEVRARDLFYALWIPDLFMKRVEADGEGILTFVLADTSFGGAQIAVAAPIADCRAAIEHVAEHAVPPLVDATGVVSADDAAVATGRQAPVRFAALAWAEGDAPAA